MTIPNQVRQLIDSSGNTFHAKVARWLQSDGWQIRVSPYYMDQSHNKAREIDLIAEKSWPMSDVDGHRRGEVVVRLFVECKFVPTYAVFWFAEKDMPAAEELVYSCGGFQSNNIYTREHHYLSSSLRVAKLFASETNRGQDYEPFYKALNQVLNAQVSMSEQPTSLAKVERTRGGRQLVINYPIVVCSSFEKVYATDFYGETEPIQVQENFQLEIQYAYVDKVGAQRDDYFLVDFVEYSRLAEFSNLLTREAEIADYLAK